MRRRPAAVEFVAGIVSAHAPTFAKFGIVGVINTAVDFAVFSVLFYGVGLPLLAANSLAVSAGASNSYLLNKYWTFTDRTRGREAFRAAAVFFALTLIGMAIANAAIWALSFVVPVLMAKLLSIAITMLWNYTTYRRFVYRQRVA